MSERTHIAVLTVILSLLTLICVVGIFTSSWVMGIFALAFGFSTAAVLWDLRRL